MDTVAALAPFIVAGSILPTWTIVVIALLGTEQPVANGTAFVLGNAAYRALLGVAVLFALPLPDSESFRLDSGVWDARLVMAVGVGLLALAAWIWMRPAAPEGASWVERAARIRPRTAFVAGALMTASPGVQYAYLLGGIAAVLDTTSEPVARLAALGLFVIALQWMLVTPIVVYVLFPERSERILQRMKAWLRAYGQRLIAGVLGVAGAYVTVIGVQQLLA